MGVSKQAAQQRWVPRWGTSLITAGRTFGRFTDRARSVLIAANRLAGGAQATAIGARASRRRPVRRTRGARGQGARPARGGAADLAAALDVTAEPADAVSDLPFDERAEAVLDAALREALRLQHNFIGTEHLLLGSLATARPHRRIPRRARCRRRRPSNRSCSPALDRILAGAAEPSARSDDEAEVGEGADVERRRAVAAQAVPAGGGDHRRVVGAHRPAGQEAAQAVLGAARRASRSRSSELAATPPPRTRPLAPTRRGARRAFVDEHVDDRLLERRGDVGGRRPRGACARS